MSIVKSAALVGALASIALVDAHGTVTGILANGNYIGGYLIGKYPYMPNPPAVAGWSTTATDNGFVLPNAYTSPDIICHRDAKPGALTAEVPAGSTLELQWTQWPDRHFGPVLDYLANCNGDCSTVDKTTLEFFKIQEAGLVDGSSNPGTWATNDLIANNNTWKLTIPSSIAPGNYVLRHEIISLHSAYDSNGAQNYPQCFNLKITGGGTAKPKGQLATTLYKSTDPGIHLNIYEPFGPGYEIPGPAVFTDGGNSGGNGSSGPSDPATPSSSPAAPATAVTPSPDATPTIPSDESAPAVSGCSARYNKRSQRPHAREFNHRR
ncbi:hypothetical protein GX51_07288 [Blastomyces parvus]|uniref:Auxiliary Activity family 9 catalytic domain-containing protein n=1 Tax=Blastomyces parvus TaxID=2060905 RepID=A0A2B7WLQ9_9EURO|nr:hypothetical protein GX51_07288 [Blastomyces parvus]